MYSHINFIFLLSKSQRNVPVFNKRKALNAVQWPVLKFVLKTNPFRHTHTETEERIP